MLLRLQNLLSSDEVLAMRDIIQASENFSDGRNTAGRAARQVKTNTQLEQGAELDTIRKRIRAALDRNTLFNAFARPKSITRILVSRYTTGMAYGTHVDEALMAGKRTDLSFTLFLSEPESYSGGELVMDDLGGETEIKLEAGDAVIYPTGVLHRVAPVESGERLAVVGWVRSLVRRADQREILFDLDMATHAVFDREGKSDLYDRLAKTRSNLLRLWAED